MSNRFLPTRSLPTRFVFTRPSDATSPTKRSIGARRAAAVLVATSLALAACSSDGDADTSAGATDEAVATTEAAETESSSGVVATASTDAGEILVDEVGLSLYAFLPDELGTPTCGGACADAWPPLTLPSGDLPAGLDAGVFGVVDGIDGGFQLTAGGWPLYYFAGDANPGDTNGQGSGDAWFLVAPDGSLVQG